VRLFSSPPRGPRSHLGLSGAGSALDALGLVKEPSSPSPEAAS
jgi:hypothetical protein